MRVALAVGVPVIVTAVMFSWGASWDFGSAYDCASGSYFLADVGWAVEGTMLATVISMVAAGIFAIAVRGRPGIVASVATIMLIGIAGQLGATMGADRAGCPGEAGDPGIPLAIIATVFGGGTYLIIASVRILMDRRRQARDP